MNELEEYVPVRLFKDKEKYNDDVFVAVNGEGCLIRRGETVWIQRKFAEVLAQSDRQDLYAAGLMEAQAEEAARQERQF